MTKMILIVALLVAAFADLSVAGEASFSFGDIMTARAQAGSAALAAAQGDTTAAADTTNAALDELLSQFMADPESSELSYDSWALSAHHLMGWAILVGAGAQAILGVYTYNKEKKFEDPGTVDVHKYLGYTIAGLSVAQTTLGYYNFWKMRGRETGKTKRWVHLGLSTLATVGFVTAAVIANDARSQIDSGQAGIEGKTLEDLYDPHALAGTLAVTSVLLTVVVIVW